MHPPQFDYIAAQSLDEALEILAERGDEAKVLAGGQSLIPLLKLRFASPGVLVDINRIPGLDTMTEEGGYLRVDALVRHRDAERSDLLRSGYPTMASAAPQISDPLVRNLGTICGSVAHADPSGDWGAVMLAMNAQFVAKSKQGERVIAARDFFVGPFTTALRPDEMLVEVRVPNAATKGSYHKLERKVGDYATAAVAVRLSMSDGRIDNAGIGLTAVGPTNLQASEAESMLAGQEPSNELFRDAANAAAATATPNPDTRGSAEYKRDVVRVFTERGLRAAAGMAGANGGAR